LIEPFPIVWPVTRPLSAGSRSNPLGVEGKANPGSTADIKQYLNFSFWRKARGCIQVFDAKNPGRFLSDLPQPGWAYPWSQTAAPWDVVQPDFTGPAIDPGERQGAGCPATGSPDCGGQGHMQLSQEENANKLLIQKMFRDIIEREEFDEQQIARYFSPCFEQKADGKTLDYRGFLDHVRELKRTVTGLKVTVEYIVAEGNKVLDVHRVEAEKRAVGKVEARVFSLWVIEDGRIVLCDELTHLERGAAEDRDLGSRTSRP